MKYDETGCLIREFYPKGHWANLGDSCAETSRARILGDWQGLLGQFVNPDGPGFIRHPDLKDIHGWDESDFSGDQFVALYLAATMIDPVVGKYIHITGNEWKIPGTDTWLTPAAWAMIRGHWRVLDWCNQIQGKLFKASVRVGDGGKIETSEGNVQDWLNYICIYLFLKKTGRKATLNQSKEACMKAVRTYYSTEPNSQWIVDLYDQNL